MTIVIALGGNALVHDEHESILDQLAEVERFAPAIVDVLASGHDVVVTHGNGPQVGYILRRSELSLAEVAPVPIDFAVADTQGAIGHMFLLALRNELHRRSIHRMVTAVVTDVVVAEDDRAFRDPTKPIGSMFDQKKAEELAATFGWSVANDSGRGWRRVVPSPVPIEIAEAQAIATLLRAGHVVIAAGGGGVPVVRMPDGRLKRVEAVVDKDLTSALLAHQLNASMLMLLTTTDRVAIAFGRTDQRWLSVVGVEELRAHLHDGEFGAGSMAPKIEAAIRFVDAPGPGAASRTAVITSPELLMAAVRGDADVGTRIVRSAVDAPIR